LTHTVGDAFLTGGTSCILSIIGSHIYLNTSPIATIAVGGAAAGISLSLRRMHHEMNAMEVIESSKIKQTNHASDLASDLGVVLYRTVKDSVLWAIPSSFAYYSFEGVRDILYSLNNAGINYGRLGEMLWNKICGVDQSIRECKIDCVNGPKRVRRSNTYTTNTGAIR